MAEDRIASPTEEKKKHSKSSKNKFWNFEKHWMKLKTPIFRSKWIRIVLITTWFPKIFFSMWQLLPYNKMFQKLSGRWGDDPIDVTCTAYCRQETGKGRNFKMALKKKWCLLSKSLRNYVLVNSLNRCILDFLLNFSHIGVNGLIT